MLLYIVSVLHRLHNLSFDCIHLLKSASVLDSWGLNLHNLSFQLNFIYFFFFHFFFVALRSNAGHVNSDANSSLLKEVSNSIEFSCCFEFLKKNFIVKKNLDIIFITIFVNSRFVCIDRCKLILTTNILLFVLVFVSFIYFSVRHLTTTNLVHTPRYFHLHFSLTQTSSFTHNLQMVNEQSRNARRPRCHVECACCLNRFQRSGINRYQLIPGWSLVRLFNIFTQLTYQTNTVSFVFWYSSVVWVAFKEFIWENVVSRWLLCLPLANAFSSFFNSASKLIFYLLDWRFTWLESTFSWFE